MKNSSLPPLTQTLRKYQGQETRDAPIRRIFRHKPLLAGIVVHPAAVNQDTMAVYSLKPDYVCGHAEFPEGSWDKMQGVILNLKPGIGEGGNEILRLCNTVLSAEPTEAKAKYMEENYQIKMTADMQKEVESMTGYQEAAYEEGIRKGSKQGLEQGKIIGAIQTLRDTGMEDSQIRSKVMMKYSLDDTSYAQMLAMAEEDSAASA